MTNKEAIEILWRYDVNFEPHPAEEVMHAIDMAINALTAQSEERTQECTETHSCDCVSRQAAIDLFPNDDLECDTKGGYIAPHLARQMISELPSAQPDLSSYSDKLWHNAYERGKAEAQPEIVHCKDCKWKQGAECVRFAEIRVFPNDFCSRAERREE